MLKQTLAMLKNLGWLKLTITGLVFVLLVSTGVWAYLRQTNTTPTSTPTPGSNSPSTSDSTPSQTPKSTEKPADKPAPQAAQNPTQQSAPTQAPASNTPSSPTTPPPSNPPSSGACTNPVWNSSDFHGQWITNGYMVENNVWNDGEAGPQSIYACAWNNWYIISDQPGSGTDDSVKSYPATKKIVDIPLSSMNTVSSSWSVATPSAGGQITPNSKQWNAAYDLWLDNYSTEVMIWTNWTANWQYWYGEYDGVDVTIDGVAYHAYYDGDEVMWFVRANVANSGSVNLKAILQWAISQGWLQSNQRINQIEYGFEVMYTGTPTRFDLLNYSLTAN
jgi:hypothetical protein